MMKFQLFIDESFDATPPKSGTRLSDAKMPAKRVCTPLVANDAPDSE
jgi:hypothetical protein